MAHKDKAHERYKVSAALRAPRKKAQAAGEHGRHLHPALAPERDTLARDLEGRDEAEV